MRSICGFARGGAELGRSGLCVRGPAGFGLPLGLAVSLGIVTCATQARATSVTFQAVADTTITRHPDLGGGNANRGTSVYLNSIGGGFGEGFYFSMPLVRWDIQAYRGFTFGDATVQLYQATALSSANIAIAGGFQAWNETTVTYNNYNPGSATKFGSIAYDSRTVDTTVGWKSWTLHGYVMQDWANSPSTNYGLSFANLGYTAGTATSGDGQPHDHTFTSRESANDPRIIVNATAPTFSPTQFNNGPITIYEGQTATISITQDAGAYYGWSSRNLNFQSGDGQSQGITGALGLSASKTDSVTFTYAQDSHGSNLLANISGSATADLTSGLSGYSQTSNVSSSVLVRVLNVAPTIDPVSSVFVDWTVNPTASFLARATDPGIDDLLTFSWDLNGDGIFGDYISTGYTGDVSAITRNYFSNGIYSLGVRVDDGDGGVTTRSFSLTVIPAPGAASLLGLGGLMASRRRRRA